MGVFSFFAGVDMTDTDVFGFATGGIDDGATSSELVFHDTSGFGELDVHGKNFGDFDENGLPHVGTIKGLDLSLFGNPVAAFSKLTIDVSAFIGFLGTGDSHGLVELALKGNDEVNGSSDADVLIGLKGRDVIAGNAGTDQLIGGSGGDTLTGGADDDTFIYQAVGDSGKKGVDTITDLSAGDTIDLHLIDASTKTDGDQAFHIVAKLKGHAGEMTVVYDADHDRTIVSMDVNGDQEADTIIWINGDHHTYSGWVL